MEGLCPEGLSVLQFYNQRKVGRGKRPPSSHSSTKHQAYITSSFFVSGWRVSDSMRPNQDCHSTYSNQQKGGNIFFFYSVAWDISHAFTCSFVIKQTCFVPWHSGVVSLRSFLISFPLYLYSLIGTSTTTCITYSFLITYTLTDTEYCYNFAKMIYEKCVWLMCVYNFHTYGWDRTS